MAFTLPAPDGTWRFITLFLCVFSRNGSLAEMKRVSGSLGLCRDDPPFGVKSKAKFLPSTD